MKTALTNSGFAMVFIACFSFFVFHFSLTYAQVPTVQDCLGAIPICQDVYEELNSYSGSGNYPNEIYNPTGDCTLDCPGSCLDGEQNSVWYIITVQHDGNLRFTLDPAGNDDYDWAVYDLTEFQCSDIRYNYSQMQKSCNAYGGPPDDSTGISTANGGTTDCNHCGSGGSSLWNMDLFVTKGRTYVLVVENWSGTNDGFMPARFSSTMSSTSHCCVRGSSAAVGSSNSSTSGFITRTDAIATRFFSPPESWIRRAVGEIGDLEHRQRVVDSGERPRRATTHVERSERDLVAHRGREHLRVGVLEDESDPRAEPDRELLVVEVVLGDRLPNAR